jgi:hypothetical protein
MAKMPAINDVFMRKLRRTTQLLRVSTYIRDIDIDKHTLVKYAGHSYNNYNTEQRVHRNTNSMLDSDAIAAQIRRTSEQHLVYDKTQKRKIRSINNTMATDAINARKVRHTVYERCLLDVNMHAYKGNMRYKQIQKQKKQAACQSDYQVSVQALNMSATYSKAIVHRRRSHIFAIRKCVRQ